MIKIKRFEFNYTVNASKNLDEQINKFIDDNKNNSLFKIIDIKFGLTIYNEVAIVMYEDD